LACLPVVGLERPVCHGRDVSLDSRSCRTAARGWPLQQSHGGAAGMDLGWLSLWHLRLPGDRCETARLGRNPDLAGGLGGARVGLAARLSVADRADAAWLAAALSDRRTDRSLWRQLPLYVVLSGRRHITHRRIGSAR